MFKLLLKFKKNRKGQDIIDNMVALGIFTIAFLYVVYTAANSLNPYLETGEYIDVELTAFTAIERIISDPGYGFVSRDHVMSYDKLVDFVSKEDSSKYPVCPLESSQNSYIQLLRSLGLLDLNNKRAIYDVQILIASTYIEVDTPGVITQSDIDDFNYSLPTKPTGLVYSPLDTYPPHFNTERIYLGDKYYEFLIVDENNNSEYDHIYIDINHNRDFQDEVDNKFYGTIEGIPRSGLLKDQNFSLESKDYIITEIYKNGSGSEILYISPADMKIGKKRGYSDIVLVISRLALMEEFGNLSEKRITLIMWEGDRICSWITRE